jgi:hypothetical protein
LGGTKQAPDSIHHVCYNPAFFNNPSMAWIVIW